MSSKAKRQKCGCISEERNMMKLFEVNYKAHDEVAYTRKKKITIKTTGNYMGRDIAIIVIVCII